MVDPRPGVARETIDAWLNSSFTTPLSLRGEVMRDHRAQRSADLHDAILDSLPRDRDRSGLVALCEAARQRLIRNSKAATWPTPAEVCDAFAVEKQEHDPVEPAGGWPHRNSEYVIEATIKWIERFRDWPQWLDHPREVASEVVSRTNYSKADLINLGLRVSKREAEEAGIVYGSRPGVELQRIPEDF